MNIYTKIMIAAYAIMGLGGLGAIAALIFNDIPVFLASIFAIAIGYAAKKIGENIPKDEGVVGNAKVQ